MDMHLDHTIIPAKNSENSAALYADILGVKYIGKHDCFEAVQVDGHLKLLFSQKENFETRHYAFIVTEQEYSEIFYRVTKDPDLSFGDSPSDRSNQKIYRSNDSIGFYFDDDNGHILEVIKHIAT